MSTASEITVVRMPLPAERGMEDAEVRPAWAPAAQLSKRRGPSPSMLAALAVLAGVVAMVLGGLAVLSAARADSGAASPQASAAAVGQGAPVAERRALALLAKPSTERVVFRGSRGQLVLAIGSGGRAALLLRGLEPAPEGRPYVAWVVGPERVVRAGQFRGGERAVLLAAPVGRGASVVVAPDRRTALRPGTGRLVAVRP